MRNTTKLIFDNQTDEQWFTTKEAANYLRISPQRLLNLSSTGRIKFYKFGRSNRYLKSELSELLFAQSRGGSNGN